MQLQKIVPNINCGSLGGKLNRTENRAGNLWYNCTHKNYLDSFESEKSHYRTQNILTLRLQILVSIDRLWLNFIIAEYDRLKSGQITQFPIESLADLPRVNPAARVAAGLTQKELAEKIGVHEQQIQRFIALDYHAVGFDRLQEVMFALEMTIGKTVMQLGSCNIS